MIQTIKKIFFFILLLVPQWVFAQAVPSLPSYPGSNIAPVNFTVGTIDITPSFTPLVTDLSVNYLGQIFGTVGTVLHGTSGQMLGQLFKVFNIGILVIAGIFLIYTIIMTVINTAQEGEFMGRKWNSAWIAIRTVLGLGLLVPSPTTGYSTVQVIVMWVVIQGAGFANMAWYTALNYLQSGGEVYVPPSTDTSSMVDLVGNILEMQVCMYKAEDVQKKAVQNQKAVAQAQQTGGATTNTAAPPTQSYVTSFQPLFTVIIDPNDANKVDSVLKFPGVKYTAEGQQGNECGQINFGSDKSIDDLNKNQKVTTLKTAVQQILLDTESAAKKIARPDEQTTDISDQVQSSIVGAAADWVNLTLPIRTIGPSVGDALMLGYFTTAVQQGWIMAGRYYYALGNIRRVVADATMVAVNIDQAPAGMVTPSKGTYISFQRTPPISADNMSLLGGFSDQDKSDLVKYMGDDGVAKYVAKARAVAQQVDQASQVNLNIGSAGILGFLLDPVESFLLILIGQLTTAVGDPILIIQGFGYGFMALAGTMWIGATIGAFTTGAASSIMSSLQPLGYAVSDALFAFIPQFTIFILLFFTMGATFAFYIPLIPFIIFVFAAVGWMISVIEAMVAAPLVALGITHPEGHDLLGKSEQAIMMLLSVFLRPILMIIGLFAGMILSRVVLRFLNSGFFGIVFDVGDFNLFAFVAILVVYCMLLVTIVNQAFSLIYVVPDRVMRWLGVSEQTTGVTEALQAAKGGFEQVAAAPEKVGGGMTGKGYESYGKQLEAQRTQKGKKLKAEGE